MYVTLHNRDAWHAVPGGPGRSLALRLATRARRRETPTCSPGTADGLGRWSGRAGTVPSGLRRGCRAGPRCGTVRINASRIGTPASTAEQRAASPGHRLWSSRKPNDRQQNHHHQGDEVTHRPRRRRGAVVVARDGVEHRLGQLVGTAVPKDLSVEDQVHPQHGHQEAGAGGRDQHVTRAEPRIRRRPPR